MAASKVAFGGRNGRLKGYEQPLMFAYRVALFEWCNLSNHLIIAIWLQEIEHLKAKGGVKLPTDFQKSAELTRDKG